MRRLILINLFFISFIICFNSCKVHSDKIEVVNYRLKGDEIIIPDSSNIRPKLKIGKVVSEPFRLQTYSAAKIKAIPNNYAEISPPFNGRIAEVFVSLGQNVSRGTPMFTIYSADYSDAQKMYYQAKQQFMLAEKDFKRQKDLLDNGVGVQRDLESARTAFEINKSELEKANTSIKIFGVDPEKMIFGEPLTVRSPIHGQVIKNSIVVGKYITDNSSPILTIAEISKVWITASVKEKDIRFVSEGDITETSVTAYPGEVFKGKVFHVDEVVDEETRSINVLIECPNRDEKLKPGMYATVRFTQRPGQAVFVPTSALLQYNDRNFVYLQIAPGHFKKQLVTTAETINDRTVIVEGLIGDETIIVQGGFYLLEAK